MFLNPKPLPVTIVVSKDRWDAFDAPTPRNKALVEHLKQQGGINESVPPGLYHYNVYRKGFRHYASLEPALKD